MAAFRLPRCWQWLLWPRCCRSWGCLAVWPPLQRQAGLWLAQAQVQVQVQVKVRQAAEGALRRPSAQAQLGVGQVAQSEAVQGVEGQAWEALAGVAVPQPQQAALRVRAKQAQQFRVVFVLAGLAFSRLVRWPPVCLLQAYSPHAVLVPALLFEQMEGWLRSLVQRRQLLAGQTQQPPHRARCRLSIAMARTDPAASEKATASTKNATRPGAATQPAAATGRVPAFASEAMDRMVA